MSLGSEGCGRAESDQDGAEKIAQKIRDTSQEAEQLPKIETRGREQCVAAISGAALQPVAAQQSIVLRVADNRFDHGAAFEPAFDFIRDASSLSGDIHRC